MSKKQITCLIEDKTVEKIKDLVYWTPGLTMSLLIENILTKVIDQIELEEPIKPREGKLKRGRSPQ